MNSRYQVIIVVYLLVGGLYGCKKYVQVDAPYTSLNGENVYTTDATAIAAVTAMYTNMGIVSNGGLTGKIPYFTYTAGLSADELALVVGAPEGIGFYTNDLTATSAPDSWIIFYSQIYLANAAIEGLANAAQLTSSIKQQLLGEAKFMRAFYYFYLVNIYGDVPLVLSTNYHINSLMSRTPSSQVWQQIKTDLSEAKDLLSANYVGSDVITNSSTTERIRPNKWAAAALLARVYLFTGGWANAESQSTEIIDNSGLYSLSTINNTFLKNPSVNKEAIWQIQGVTTGWNTNDARLFILPSTGPSPNAYPVYLNKRLVYSFENGDARYTNWIKGIKVGTDSFYYAYKYKSATLNASVTEYNVVFRLAEQYLIRAEARAMQGKIQQAIDDVNTIRQQHGGLSNPLLSPMSQTEALNIILHERRVELFCEWGDRWLDLKRTNTVDAVMNIETPLKGNTWQTTDKLYPIPISELIVNPNLTQTPGY
jgi:hypothetical protein